MDSANLAEYDFVINLKQPPEFGAFWEMLRQFRTNCTMLMPKYGIFVRETSAQDYISVSAYVSTQRPDLCGYSTNYTDPDGNPVDSGIVGFNVKQMALNTKKATGATNVILMKKKSASNITVVQTTPGSRGGKSYVQTEQIEPTLFVEPQYSGLDTTYNAFEFANFFTKANSAKAIYVEMAVQSSQFVFRSYRGQKDMDGEIAVPRAGSYSNPLTMITSNPLEMVLASVSRMNLNEGSSSGVDATFEIMGEKVIKMNKVVMKVLGKIHALCGKKSSVYINYEEGLPLKISVSWGEFGEVSYYIQDNPSL